MRPGTLSRSPGRTRTSRPFTTSDAPRSNTHVTTRMSLRVALHSLDFPLPAPHDLAVSVQALLLAVPPCLLTSRIPSHAPCRSTPPFPSQADFVDKQFTKEEVAEKVLEQYDEAGGGGKRRSCPDRHNSFVQNRVHPLLFFLSISRWQPQTNRFEGNGRGTKTTRVVPVARGIPPRALSGALHPQCATSPGLPFPFSGRAAIKNTRIVESSAPTGGPVTRSTRVDT
jgi:hypothetical protein